MSQRFDACTAIPKKDGGVYWHRVGSAFSNDKGGVDIMFNSLPIGEWSEGYGYQVRVKLFPAKPKGQSAPQQDSAPLDDDIPF